MTVDDYLIKFLSRYIGENINIKWPNDININDCKIAGIMTEIVEQDNNPQPER